MELGFGDRGRTLVFLSVLAISLALSLPFSGVFAAEGNVSVVMSAPAAGSNLSGVQTFSATTDMTGVNMTWRYYDSGYFTVCFNTSATTSFSNTSCDLSSVPEGTYNFSAWANLTGANESWSDNVSLTVDNNAPDVDFASNNPAQSNWSNTDSVLLNITVSDNRTESCIFEINATNYTNTSSEGSCSYYFSSLADGNWIYTAWANDTAGNYNSTETRWMVIETEAPSVTVHSPNASTKSTVPVLFNFTVVDEVRANFTCQVWFNGTLINTSYPLNNTPKEFNVGGLDRGLQTWEINCSDGNYTYASGNSTFSLYPNIVIEDLWWSHSPHNNTAPGDTINVTVLVNLTGTFNLTDNFTVRTRFDSGTWYSQNVSNDTLTTEDSSLLVNFVQNITVSTAGNHTLTAGLVLYETDASSSDNTLLDYVYAGYIVDLVNTCYGATCTYNNTNGYEAAIPPGENVTVNVSVQYPNGTYVTGLTSEMFKVYKREDSGSATYDPAWTNTSMSLFGSGGATGHYKFRYTTPDLVWGSNYHNLADQPGRYYLYVNITSGDNYNYASTDYAFYNVSAPYFTISYSVPSTVQDLAGEDYKLAYFNITISNAAGTAAINDIQMFQPTNYGVNLFTFGTYDGSIDCDSENITTIAPGASYTNCRMRIKTTVTGDDRWTNVTGVGYDAEGNMYYYSLKRTFDIEDSDADSSGDTGSGSTPSSTGDDFNFDLTITDYPAKVYAFPGGSNRTNVTVKNTGDTVLVAKLKVVASGAIDSATITPVSQSLSPGSSVNFTIDFTVSDTADVREHSGTFTAYMSTDQDVNSAKTFKVVVMATEGFAEQINTTFVNKTGLIQDILSRFAMINPASVNDSNYTAVQALIQKLNTTFVSIRNAIDSGDWVTANSLMATLQSDMDNAEAALDDLELEQTVAWGGSWSGIWFWVIIVVVMVIVVGFVAYLFYPQKKGVGLAPLQQGGGFLDKLRGVFGSLKSRTKSAKLPKRKKKAEEPVSEPRGYIEGYEKHAGSFAFGASPQKKGIIKRIKEKLKKKKPQKSMSEFFSSGGGTERIIRGY